MYARCRRCRKLPLLINARIGRERERAYYAIPCIDTYLRGSCYMYVCLYASTFADRSSSVLVWTLRRRSCEFAEGADLRSQTALAIRSSSTDPVAHPGGGGGGEDPRYRPHGLSLVLHGRSSTTANKTKTADARYSADSRLLRNLIHLLIHLDSVQST